MFKCDSIFVRGTRTFPSFSDEFDLILKRLEHCPNVNTETAEAFWVVQFYSHLTILTIDMNQNRISDKYRYNWGIHVRRGFSSVINKGLLIIV